MVSSTARFILVHHEIESSSRRPILLPAFEDDFYFYAMGMEEFQHSARCSACHRLNHLCITGIRSSGPHCRRRSPYAAVAVFQRPTFLRRLALRTITSGVHLHNPTVRSSGGLV